MKLYKKIIIGIIVAITTIIGINSISDAYDYKVEDEVNVSYNEYLDNGDIYCMEHGQKLKGTETYTIVSQVIIEGTKSTDHTGKTIDNIANARFAAILSADNGAIKDDGPVAKAIWKYGYTWMKEVGRHHAGLELTFAGTEGGEENDVYKDAIKYANTIEEGKKITDNTKKENIKVVQYKKDNKQYLRIGPFNWSFGGTMAEVTAYDQNQKPIAGILYSSFNGTKETWFGVDDITSEKDFYISIPIDGSVTKITKISGKAKLDIKCVKIWFLESTKTDFQNLLIREPYPIEEEISAPFDYNIPIKGSLKVIKVNKDNKEVKLPGVGFYIKNKDLGKYVKQGSNGEISYVDERKNATEFITDKNGEILIKNLVVGTYIAYETKNPNYGYEIIKDGQEKTIVVDKTTELVKENPQKYVKLSGYVWLDEIFGKQSYRNDLFKDNDYDSNDMLLDGITVKLKDKSGKVIQETKTSNGGAYLFIDVLAEKLSDYYIEFEYDGLTYTNVIPHKDKNNGSKSSESITEREEFNKNFSVIEGRTENTGFTRDDKGNEKYNLSYNLDQSEHNATLINNGQYKITANTNEAGYIIGEHFTYGQEEIKYINLGLYKREQPDIALLKDIKNVKVAVNGYNHIYEYDQRFVNQGEYGDGFNVGVKFGNKYGSMSYTRPIYKADYEYVNENDKSKELKVYVTYKLALRNESSNLIVQVNNIVDYYDTNYKLLKAGMEINEKGEILKEVSHNESGYNEKYAKSIINSNIKIDPQKQTYVYVQFELNREAVIKILNNEENLDNVAEINSYSVFDNSGKVYAGIDKDSNPGNVTPENKSLFQDDTDTAPGLQLVLAEARKITGTVFVDSTTGELRTAQERLGDGEFKQGDTVVQDVQVTMYKEDGTKYAETRTDRDGNYTIANFIPGKYKIVYIWGDKTYTVDEYKSTIYKENDRQQRLTWYMEKIDTRYSDAIDNYNNRLQIDSGEHPEITTMDSTTPTMEFGVELRDIMDKFPTTSGIDKVEFVVKNIDFGIVERARQVLDIYKRVSSVKITLASGQVIADAKVEEENGELKLKGDILNGVTFIPQGNQYPKNGFIRLELDNEIIQGATVEIEYEIIVENNSELDYDSENYYKYGTDKQNLIIVKPVGVYDYIDKELIVGEESTEWEIKADSTYYEEVSEPTVIEKYMYEYYRRESTLEGLKEITGYEEFEKIYQEAIRNWTQNTVITARRKKLVDKTILYNADLERNISPGEKNVAKLKASKVLSSTDEIALNNDVEVVEVTRDQKTGRQVTPKISNLYDRSETVIITPPTGNNKNYLPFILLGVSCLIILGTGILFIKKKILK